MFLTFLLIFFILYFLIQVFLILLLLKPDKPVNILNSEYLPFVSVMVAARNEEQHITKCLESLSKQDYPAGKFEILTGNDRSSDKTGEIMETFVRNHTQFRYFNITTDLGPARGKSNVLAQLCHYAKGEIFLFTDADITVPETWISRMTESFMNNKGIVMNSGATYIKGLNFMQNMQGLEWIFSLGIFKASAEAGIPLSAVGNNMGVRRENYFKTGGYENMDFNIVEDYQLFRNVMKQGGKFQMIFDRKALNISAPATTVKDFLNQKNRWMKGAITCPWHHKIIMGLPFLFPYIVIVVGFLNLKMALSYFIMRILLEWIYLYVILKKLKIKTGIYTVLLYPLYYLFMQQIMVVSAFLSGRVVWKGRIYRGIIFGSRRR